MIKRIRIEGYKSFAELDLRLQPLSVMFGPNAAGKSNLLDAVYLLSRAVSRKTLAEAFEGHRGLPLESFHYGAHGHESLLRRKHLTLAFEVDVEVPQSIMDYVRQRLEEENRKIGSTGTATLRKLESLLRYRLEIDALPESGVARVIHEHLSSIGPSGGRKRGGPGYYHEGKARELSPIGGQGRSPVHYMGREGTFGLVRDFWPVVPEVLALQLVMSRWRVYYLEPRALMREETPRAEIRSLGPRGEGLAAFLNLMRAEDKRSYEAFRLAFRQVMPGSASLDLDLTREGLVSLRVTENGARFSGRLISEGTLRLLGLLAALHPRNEATVIAFEEPENGVHPVRLKIIADLLKEAVANGKQVLVTTHSPLLLEHFQSAHLFVCRKEGPASQIKSFGSLPGVTRRARIARDLTDRIIRGDYGG